MNLKSKILAAGLAAIIAGSGIFAANINTAQAQTDGEQTDSAIAQMMQMIETLKQQIQQIIALIAQLKPQETCGNGACRFGETAASCPADCQKLTIDCVKEGEKNYFGKPACCANLTPVANSTKIGGDCIATSNGASICVNCGNNVCGSGENECNCPADCGKSTSDNGKAKCLATGGAWIDSECAPGCETPLTVCKEGYMCKCLSDKYWASCEEGCINKPTPACGNGACETGETASNCAKDCADKFGKTTVICAPGNNCRAKACYGEGEGEIGLIAGPVKPCCHGLTPHPSGTQAVTEGFVCRKPVAANCKKEGELFGYLEGQCCDGLLKVYPDGAKTYSAGESQNFQVTCKKPASYITNTPDKCVAVNIKALVNDKYVTAENGGASPLIASRDTAGPQELFYIYPTTNDGINIKSVINGKYVIAENGGSSPLIASRDEVDPWGRFVLSPIFNTRYVTIKASANNRIVTAENGGRQSLVANRDEIGLWEKFTITKVSDCQIQ